MLKDVWARYDLLCGLNSFSDWAVAYWVNIVLFEEPHKVILDVVRVELNFRTNWLNPAVGQNVPSALDVEVREANRLNKTLINK